MPPLACIVACMSIYIYIYKLVALLSNDYYEMVIIYIYLNVGDLITWIWLVVIKHLIRATTDDCCRWVACLYIYINGRWVKTTFMSWSEITFASFIYIYIYIYLVVGPLSFDYKNSSRSSPTFKLNPYSWTKVWGFF